MSDASRLALGGRFAEAVSARDFESLTSLLAPDVHLRALVPAHLRDEVGVDAVIGRLRFWWEEAHALDLIESDVAEVGGLVRVRYQLRVDDPDDGVGIQEQTAYLTVEGGRVAAINLVCTGQRPLPGL